MKYRRKPTERDVVDAVLIDGEYIYASPTGALLRAKAQDFELVYAPIKRERVAKKRKKKDATETTAP